MRPLKKTFKERAKELKAEAKALIIAYTDNRTPLMAKVIIGLTLGYLFSPLDLIPDFIPVLGLVDDLIIVPALIAASIKLIPFAVMKDAREKAKNSSGHVRKNWYFGAAVITLWFLVLYLIYKVLL